jgi:5-formyltetrahydrofolate cyclo-ligase
MGYYDKYLSDYNARYPHHKTHLIGLAFTEQIVESLPTDARDWPLDLIVTN